MNRAKFHFDRLRGFCLAGIRKLYVAIGKHGRPQHSAYSASALARDRFPTGTRYQLAIQHV
jgi:hypothetical protein